ncbi:MAG: MarR family transcriptional regulator [Candidatus Omnitrophota bacterium]
MFELSLSEFADRLNQIIPVLIKGFSRAQLDKFTRDKLTFPQFLILNYLSLQHGLRMTDMARFMKVSTPAITGIVGRLVRAGFCTREFDDLDRRTIRIRLTPKGRALVEKVNSHRHKMIIKIFGKISSADRREYLRILTRIHEVLKEEERHK